jgi:putative transposase
VKHGLVQCPHEWEYSSFRWFVGEGMYAEDWGCGEVDFVGEELDVGE